MATLPPPQSPMAYEQRPQSNRVMSFASNRSHRSSNSAPRNDLVESPRDKRKLATTSKSDPRAALNEEQPAVVALQESTLEDIHAIQHKDNSGNVITDPDRSNPTRYRLERPLDTIRAFNAAAEGTASRRASYQSRPSPGSYSNSRRQSYYGNYQGPQSPPQRPGGYYKHSSYGMRPDGYAEELRAPRYPRQQQQHPHHHHMPHMHQQQPGFYGDSPSSAQSQFQSYETATSGSDEYSKSTDPSSLNSSFDQLQQVPQRKPEDSPPQPYEQDSYFPGSARPYAARLDHPSPGYLGSDPYGRPSPPPQQQQPWQRSAAPQDAPQPMKLSRPSPPLPQKRQSWIKRTFSRSNS